MEATMITNLRTGIVGLGRLGLFSVPSFEWLKLYDEAWTTYAVTESASALSKQAVESRGPIRPA